MTTKTTFANLFTKLEHYFGEPFVDNQEVDISHLGITVETPSGEQLVQWAIKKFGLPTVRVAFTDGRTSDVAAQHIYIRDNGSDVKACDLVTGDNVQARGGDIEVVSVTQLGVDDCYDIGIPHPHVYYDADGILHHNTIITGALSKLSEEFGRTLTIVPSKSLVLQTEQDYRNIGLDVGVYYGDRKDLSSTHTISTWQSLGSLMKKKGDEDETTIYDLIEGVNAVIVDECHTAKGPELQALLSGPLAHIPLRWGLTGTIPKDEIDQLRLLTCLGPVVGNITAKELMDQGVLAKCHINVLQTNDDHLEFKTYQEEKQYLLGDTYRLKWLAGKIQELAKQGNTLVLVDRIETGMVLQSMIKDSVFISGVVKNEERKEEYDSMQNADNKVLIASYGVASTGISINRIFHLVLLEPGKSFVRVIQSIGRGVRVAKDKDYVDVWDVTSTLKFSARHLKARKAFYKEAKYPSTVIPVNY